MLSRAADGKTKGLLATHVEVLTSRSMRAAAMATAALPPVGRQLGGGREIHVVVDAVGQHHAKRVIKNDEDGGDQGGVQDPAPPTPATDPRPVRVFGKFQHVGIPSLGRSQELQFIPI
ncbi:MAG: hypothetical protein QF450_00135 [Rhodospirillales bacterium]|nr:hypothetical protein [Rhodospirillales bacterium]HJO72677.1 hypothetical protein [Rhodospirillales bacterium]